MEFTTASYDLESAATVGDDKPVTATDAVNNTWLIDLEGELLFYNIL